MSNLKIHSERNFIQILDAISDMVLVKGPGAKLLWANRSFRDYYGMTNEQLQGLIDAPFNEPDYTEQYVKDDTFVFENGIVLDIPEEVVIRHDQERRYFHTVKSPIFNERGEVVMTVGISRDITERKQVEKDLKVEQERSVYSAKMASLGEMAGGIAHEINTPLASIMMLAGQSLELFEDENPNHQMIKKNLAKIETITERIAKIIVGLRSFSRDGKNDEVTDASMETIVEETLAFSRQRFINHGIELKVTHAREKPILPCRPTEISQVLLNLINNAHDAAAESKGEKWVSLETRVVHQHLEIIITDSGPGIPPDVRQKIFMPFFTTKEVGQGTGLGLSISKGIIQSHGGQIHINLAHPQTQFIIQLPLTKT